MDTPARLLRLLALLSSRGSWRGNELVERLEITDRTLRRDITRLRDLGYPIEATTGPYGGYSLGSGGRLPPLLVDDDEAVAMAVALHEVAQRSSPALAEAALSALAKLGQVMPASLRERVAAFGDVTVGIGRRRDHFAPDGQDPSALLTLALTCHRSERIRFDYVSGDGRESVRHVEPFRLVSLGQRWYLVADDLDRGDWRTFRTDRISRVRPTGARFVPRDPPDAAAFVAQGVAVDSYEQRATIHLHCPPAEARHHIPPTVGVVSDHPHNAEHSSVELGGDADWVARYLASIEISFEVVSPPEVHKALQRLGERLVADHTR